MAASISTHTTSNAEYETKNSPSMLIESITKQAENARKYERIFEYGSRRLVGYTNGNSEADTVERGEDKGVCNTKGGERGVSHQEKSIRGLGSRVVTLASIASCIQNSQ